MVYKVYVASVIFANIQSFELLLIRRRLQIAPYSPATTSRILLRSSSICQLCYYLTTNYNQKGSLVQGLFCEKGQKSGRRYLGT